MHCSHPSFDMRNDIWIKQHLSNTHSFLKAQTTQIDIDVVIYVAKSTFIAYKTQCAMAK